MKLKKKTFWTLGMVLLVIGIGVKYTGYASSDPGAHDEFAQCLTDRGAKFYGAYWCPHCQTQKAMFGKSIKYVDYIECSLPNRAGQTKVCTDAGITGYPTWKFSDGTELSGAVSLERLSEKTGCTLGSAL